MQIRIVATIVTALVLIAGFAIISPLFFQLSTSEPRQKIMLSFSIIEPENSVEWCNNLSAILNSHNIGASVFLTGKIAENSPQTVLAFGDQIDIGSRTYSNVDLTSISDYSIKLQEITQGKIAIDKAGNINSKIFQAPYQATDQDIYSLLARSNITVDFSYDNQYNIYQNGQFIKFDALTFAAHDYPPDYFLTYPITDYPLIITFNNTYSIHSIATFLNELVTGNFIFVNASDLVDSALTIRGA